MTIKLVNNVTNEVRTTYGRKMIHAGFANSCDETRPMNLNEKIFKHHPTKR